MKYKTNKSKFLFLLLSALSIPSLFAQEKGLDQQIDEAFKPFSDAISSIVFFQILGVPFVLILLVGSALFFTIYFGFVNIRRFPTAINVVRGKYDELDESNGGKDSGDSEEGEVTHFQALATAVSGTVGNGNIAGVALA
ncbi:alanine:cation symporter family protein, partial [Flavobacteriaceae bacterium]|nr:alanine:cation symporter family protein [Flavobacteriaceae bacterium]